MAFEGILTNAFVTLLAGSCYLFVAAEVHRRKAHASARSGPAVAFFLIVGVYLLVAGARQVAAFIGTVDPAYAEWDRVIYGVVVVPAAFAIVPLAYLTALAAWGRERLARGIALGFTAAAVAGLALVYLGGITGPQIGYWGSDWSINSLAAKVMILLFLTVPAILASVLLIYTGSQMRSAAGNRFRLLGWSCLVYYVAFTLDAYGLEGWPFITARLATAGAACLGYVAYVHVPGDAARNADPALS